MLDDQRVTRDARELAKHLLTWRKLLGYTTTQVAERAGISRPTLGKIEKGDPTVSLAATLSVARVLGITGSLLSALDPYESDLGRASADRVLPQRVRR